MKKTLISLLIIVSLSATLSAAADLFKGPFKAEALAFYFVHEGGPLAIVLDVLPENPGRFPKVLACFYRADETLAGWNYRKMEPGKKVVFRQDYGADAPKGIFAGVQQLYRRRG